MCGGTRERGELKPGQWVSRKRAQERSLEYAPTKGLGGAHERDPKRTGLQGRGGLPATEGRTSFKEEDAGTWGKSARKSER